MASGNVIYKYLYTYGNASAGEISGIKIEWSYGTITNNGTNATTTINTSLYIHRDSYAVTETTFKGRLGFVTGTDRQPTDAESNGYEKYVAVFTDWVLLNSYSRSVTWPANEDLTVYLWGREECSNGNNKLDYMDIPTSYWSQSYNGSVYSTSGSRSFTIPKQTTACGAPTSISLSRNSSGSIVKPTDTVKISWSGASSGVSNTIATYQVYLRVSSEGSAPSTGTYTYTKNVDVTNGTTSGSTTIDVSGLTRGHKIVAGVVTRGTAGSSFYSGIKTGGSVTVNSLPGAPSGSDKTVSSTTSSTTLVVSAGSDSNGQSTSLYYSTSSTGSKTAFTSNSTSLSLPSTSNAFYFWTYDGLEYSSYTTITITKNNKKSISLSHTSTPTVATINNLNSPWDSTDGQNVSVKALSLTATTSDINSYKFKIQYGNNYSQEYSDSSFNNTTGKLTISDIRSLIGTNKIYRIVVVGNDGIEDTDPAYYDTVNNKTLGIAPFPQILDLYNDFDCNNYTYSNSNYSTMGKFYNKVSIKFNYDSFYDSLLNGTCNLIPGSASKIPASSVIWSKSSTNYFFCNIECPSNLATKTGNNNIQYKFEINFTTTYGETQTTSDYLIQSQGVNLGFEDASLVVNPFGNSDGNIVKQELAFQIDGIEDFDLDSLPVVFQIEQNGQKSNIDIFIIEKEYSPELSAIKAKLNVSEALFNFLTIDLGLSTESDYKYNLIATTRNIFGKEVVNTIEEAFNFAFINAPEPYGDGMETEFITSNNIELNNSTPIYETMELKFNPTIQVRNSSDIEWTLYINRGSANQSSFNPNTVNWTTYASGRFSPGIIPSFGAFKQVEFEQMNISHIVGEITQDAINNFKFVITQNGKRLTKDKENFDIITTTGYPSKRFVAPEIEENSATYDSVNKKIEIVLSLKDQGHTDLDYTDDEIKLIITSKGEELSLDRDEFTINSEGKTVYTFDYEEFTDSFITCETEVIMGKDLSDYGKGILTKSTKTAVFAIYNVSPTVAYRPNRLGINTAKPIEASILDIWPSFTNNKIIIHKAGSEDCIIIDLETNSISGLTINGGTW